MVSTNNIKKIKELIEEFFSKMTIGARVEIKADETILDGPSLNKNDGGEQNKETVEVIVRVDDPQVLIGEKGQTLNEIQRLIKMIVNKKIDEPVYFNIDINDYKKKKEEYLRNLARDLADEVSTSKEAKVLLPMSAYERRIIHAALAGRNDITTDSEGQEPERRVVIKPK